MRYFSVIIFAMFISAAAYAQVDTLQLVEIGSIQAPSDITELYVEDLDGDSLKEIIICTDYYVYIYNSQTYQVEWTSPPLNHPSDLLFEDINNDGLIDLSVQDSTNIHLFDPHTPQTIWISPDMDSTYCCYTIGDRDGDDYLDLAVLSKEVFSRYDDTTNVDTVWIDTYYGNQFNVVETNIVLLPNYESSGPFPPNTVYFDREEPLDIKINRLGELSDNNEYLTIFSYTNWGYMGLITYSIYNFGEIRIYSSDFLLLFHEDVGTPEFINFYDIENCKYLFEIGRGTHFEFGGSNDYWFRRIRLFNIDTTITNTDIYFGSATDYSQGYILDNFNQADELAEMCYRNADSLYLRSIYNDDIYWAVHVPYQYCVIDYSISTDSTTQKEYIICFLPSNGPYALFSAYDGSVDYIIPADVRTINKVIDINNDFKDEVLSIQDHALIINSYESITEIEDKVKFPHHFSLSPNYPNPFNSTTTIEYGLPEAGRVRIDIYDLLGRKVETLVDGDMQAGWHRIVWIASRYSSGIYFYRIEAGDFFDTKRMVYLK